MEKSTSIKNIAAALIKFHGAVGKIPKDAKNPFFKSKYATLSSILDAISTPLETAGLSYSQLPDGNNGLTTILMHSESGEYLQSTYEMHPAKNDPQGIGSAITYARRYALGAILGLNIDDDDDGNAASQTGKQTANNTPAKPTPEKKWLNPNTPEWEKVVAFLKNPESTISQVKGKYQISPANEALLKEQTMQVA